MHHLRHSIFVSTHDLNVELEGCRKARLGRYHAGVFRDDLLPEGGLDHGGISLETVETTAGVPAGHMQNVVLLDGDTLTVVGSDMNTQAVYYIVADGHCIVFNDLFLAHYLLEALGREPNYDSSLYAENLTFFDSVSRLRAGEQLSVRLEGGSADARIERRANIIETGAGFFEDIEQSKSAMYGYLDSAVREAVEGVSEAHIALSGGIDSGTIAALIHKHRVPLTAFSLGTDWGNEYAQAQETADFLGIPLRQIHVGKDEIQSQVPAVIRFFHFIVPENIEIALVSHCLYKKLHEQSPGARVFLTGYGSDLLNGGGIYSIESPEALHARVLRELARTQRSNEFSTLAALQYGVHVRHPYWHSDVIACALRVPPAHKLVGREDKHYLREMMRGQLPEATLRRTKLGAHQGTGLSQYLARAFGGGRHYRTALASMHRTIFLHGRYP